MSLPDIKKCICCNSTKLKDANIFPDTYNYCSSCGLLFRKTIKTQRLKEDIVSHYNQNDPHESVAFSKKPFFKTALNYLVSNLGRGNKNVLDIGCGYGYFLKSAQKNGFDPYGVELSEKAAVAAKSGLGQDKIFHGELRRASFTDKQFDAITLWDVLVMMEDPRKEIKECHRILKRDGILGIRVRNILFQKAAYHIQRPLNGIYRKMGIKSSTVFHPFCFTPRSIRLLLRRSGFTQIQISNSPLTYGDPYGYCGYQLPVQFIKSFVILISDLLFFVSRGRWVTGPSLLVWAKKSE